MVEDEKNDKEMRSLALTPTWSVATVLTIFVVVSLIVERSIHRLSKWLRKTNRKPLLAAVEKMKEATSSTIANICIPSKFYDSTFAPCTKSEIDEDLEDDSSKERLEQLHRFIFVMAITHVSYSCLTMLLAIVKIHSWRAWEDEAHMDRHDILNAKARELIMQRQTAFVVNRESNNLTKNSLFIWVKCFFQQFGYSVVRADYLTLRKGFIMNHNLTSKYDFHGYMIRSMEEEFQRIVGVRQCSALGIRCRVYAVQRERQFHRLTVFMIYWLFSILTGSNLYFWIAILPITLVLLVGAKLQHVIATLALETADMTGYVTGAKLRPRDELFWFKKPEWLLSLIHFILFQNAFELASFFWFWWQFGYDSCFIRNHTLVYIRLILGFAGQFICSYITLPLYALVTQMGTNYKAALIPQRIRETIHGWGKAARRKRRLGRFTDDSTIHTETSTVMSLEEDDHRLIDIHEDDKDTYNEVELQPPPNITSTPSPAFANENSSRVGTPLLRPSSSVSASTISKLQKEDFQRSSSMPK
ncbi:MLO-like protein 11 [Gossypium arboreum]|uniref:MLO-like protein n=1 Tax=Gossypium arboreum TaxID=29729 RepID=A0A0B0NI01_GOSAR|nr:MLO-like protein 11 [Gossypium arboreum]